VSVERLCELEDAELKAKLFEEELQASGWARLGDLILEARSQVRPGPVLELTFGAGVVNIVGALSDRRGLDPALIAQSLAATPRWRGTTLKPWTVAEHTMLVASAMARAGRTRGEVAAGLLHDVEEALIGDIPAPLLKRLTLNVHGVSGTWIADLRHRCALAFTTRQETLSALSSTLVSTYDMAARIAEAQELLPASAAARVSDAVSAGANLEVVPWMRGEVLKMTWRDHRYERRRSIAADWTRMMEEWR
jgi:hypothetical protein